MDDVNREAVDATNINLSQVEWGALMVQRVQLDNYVSGRLAGGVAGRRKLLRIYN